MRKYHRLLNRQLKKSTLDTATLKEMAPFLEQINSAYINFDKDLDQAESVLELSSQELYLANKQLLSKFDAVSTRLTKVAENINDVIFEIDLKGNWKYLNPAWEKLSGYSVAECIGKPFYEKKYTFDGTPIIKLVQIDNDDFDSKSSIIKVKSASNIAKWVDISVKKILNKSGVLEGYIGTIVDISDFKSIEIALLEAKEKATLANRAKDDFLSTMSHEIRTPLNAVIGITYALLHENPNLTQLENLEALKFSSEHLLALVNDVLDFNKISSGSLDIEFAEFSMTRMLNGIQGIFNTVAKDKDIKFSIKKENGMADILIGDSVRISQILTNLVSNALKFTDKGKVTLDIEVIHETPETCQLEISVTDTGIGIPLDKQEKIFDSFAQATSDTTRKYGGTGLGLAICRQLLELMDGNLIVKSTEGVGSTFSFLLNLKKGNPIDKNDPKNKLALLDTAQLHNFSKSKILVVEDNRVNVMIIKKFLKSWGVQFDIAENGEIAVNKSANTKYSLILMDLQMPIMNGFQACKKIKNNSDSLNKEVRIYAISASTGADIRREIKDHKMDGLIPKPFNPDDLHQKLIKLLTTSSN